MTLKTRFTLIGLGLTVFAILAPALVFYARGFKYDFQTHTVVKTGTLVINTKPDKAQVFLNNELQKDLTAFAARFLIPGDYDIRVEKDGYQAWGKRLTVRPQLVTWANLNRNFISLFLKEPRLRQTLSAEAISLSKNKTEIGIAAGGQLKILQVNGGNLQTAGNYASPLAPQTITWENTNQIFELNRLNLLTEKQIKDTTRVETNGSYVALTIKSDLYLINNAELVLLDKQVTAFDLEAERIWYVQNTTIKSYDLSTGQAQITSSALPAAAAGQIRHLNNQIYLILDNNLYVLNDQLEKIYSPAAGISWDPDGRTILVTNTNELLRYDPGTKKTELILRSLTPITEAQPNGQTGYVFYINDGQLKAVELDGRDHRNVFAILKNYPAGANYAIAANGEILYLIDKNQLVEYSIY